MKLTKKEAQLEAARGAVWTALWQVPRYQAIHELKTRVFTRWDHTEARAGNPRYTSRLPALQARLDRLRRAMIAMEERAFSAAGIRY